MDHLCIACTIHQYTFETYSFYRIQFYEFALHIHDIFLPYEYPEDWVNWNWSEQYLVQSILLYGNNFDVIWPGYYLQKNLPDFGDYFLNIGNNVAQSLWLIKKSDCIGNFNET